VAVIRWLVLALLDWALLLTVPVAAPIIAAFTRPMSHDLPRYSWGGLWGTYDNPPQGDEGYVRKRAPFPGVTTGWRGYLNRCMWMLRNPLYGFAVKASVKWSPDLVITHKGNERISDKRKVPGWYFATARKRGKLAAFEFYCVLPWGLGRCLRARLGWKIMTDKFSRYGFAQLVNTCNPFDGYGDD
jgi:hypothetical protein